MSPELNNLIKRFLLSDKQIQKINVIFDFSIYKNFIINNIIIFNVKHILFKYFN